MKVVSTFIQPSSVVASAKAKLLEDDDTEFLVVAKTDRLEVFSLLPECLKLACALEVWGRITSLQTIRSNADGICKLLVVTDHPEPFALLIILVRKPSPVNFALDIVKTTSLLERNASPSEFLNGSILDPQGKAGAICSYKGKLKVLELEEGTVKSDFDTSLRELNIFSMCFLPSTSTRKIVLSILHQNHSRHLVVSSHELSLSKSELSPTPSPFLPDFRVTDDTCSLLIPVPPHSRKHADCSHGGGLLVLGTRKVYFHAVDRKPQKKRANSTLKHETGFRKAEAECRWDYSIVKAWAQVDKEGFRYLLGDDQGRLILLYFNNVRLGLNVMLLGETSTPTTITPLSPHHVYVGSHFGDAQIIRLLPDKSSSRASYVEVVDDFTNIAPVMDATVVDLKDGQHTIVTCSGGQGNGSLRIIRNGAVFAEAARVSNLKDIINLWTLKETHNAEFDAYALASTATSSHFFKLPQDESLSCSDEVVDLQGDICTLAFGNILTREKSLDGKSVYKEGYSFIQVTPKTVTLLDLSDTASCDKWSPGEGQAIESADLSASQICVALNGGRVILFTVLDGRLYKQNDKIFRDKAGVPMEISTVSISSQNEKSKFSKELVLGFWSTNEVAIVSLPDFNYITQVTMNALPRSLLLHRFDVDEALNTVFLFAGMSNGSVIFYPFTGGFLGVGKVVPLGDGPIMVKKCRLDRRTSVFAAGARSALFFWDRDAVDHMSVLVKDISSVCPLHTAAHPHSLLLSSPEGLTIGRIREGDGKNIRNIPLGLDTPLKIAFHKQAGTLAVGCSQMRLDMGSVSGTLRLFDARDYQEIREIPLDMQEEILSIITLESQDYPLFCLGSAFFSPQEMEPSRGKIRLFSASESAFNLSPHMLVSKDTNGAVNALCSCTNLLLAGINTSVVIYEPVLQPEQAELNELVKWDHNYIVIDVKPISDYIVVCDAALSLTLLTLKDSSIVTAVRSYKPLWPLCINVVDNDSVIGANIDNNLFSYRLQKQGGRVTLEENGFFHQGETVNRFLDFDAGSSERIHGLCLKQLMFTASGRISLITDADEETSKRLVALERNLSEDAEFKGPGDIEHSSWRAPANSRGPSDSQRAAVGFIDGDFLCRYLQYSDESPVVDRIFAGKSEAEELKGSKDDYRRLVEQIRRMY